jgi:hypothetical protein
MLDIAIHNYYNMPISTNEKISNMNYRISLNLLLTHYSPIIIELREHDQPQEIILEEQHSIGTLDKVENARLSKHGHQIEC